MSPKKETRFQQALDGGAKRQRLEDAEEPARPQPPKAYKNQDFINSIHCRIFRIQCEFEETRQRLEAQGISNTLMFCGSGSVQTYEGHLASLARAATNGCQDEMARLGRQQPLLK